MGCQLVSTEEYQLIISDGDVAASGKFRLLDPL